MVPTKPTVLVVDDEPMVAAILSAMLRKAGYPVVSAGGPSEALAICGNEPQIALAIVDYLMPEQNGGDLACTLKELCPGMRIVIMSGYFRSQHMLSDVRCEVNGYLPKPFKMEAAIAAVQDALG